MKYVTTWNKYQVPEELREQDQFDDEYEGQKLRAIKNDEGDFDVYELEEEE